MSCLGEIAYCAYIVGELAGGGSVARLLALVAGDMTFFSSSICVGLFGIFSTVHIQLCTKCLPLVGFKAAGLVSLEH